MKDDSRRAARPLVLFDIDGTLVDSVEMCLAGLGDSFERFTGTRPTPDFLRTLVGQPLSDQMNLLGLGETDPEGLPERIAYTIERYRVHRGLSRFFEPAIQALHQLQDAGFSTGLVTSKNRFELDEFLREHEEFRRVQVAVSSEHAPRPKPAPDPVVYACDALGVPPDQAIYVGDSTFDMAAGKDAGTRLAAVLYGAATQPALEAYEPDWILATPPELLAWAHELIDQHEKENKFRRTADPCPI